jgi:hypothetical protein
MSVAQNQAMRRDHHASGHEAEPADERRTGFGQTNFGQSGLVTLTTIPARWTVSEHLTFDEPNRSSDKARARRRHSNLVNLGIAAIVLLAAAVVAAVVTLAIRS